jgi:serine/threonine protein kinase
MDLFAQQLDALRIELNTLAYLQRLNEPEHPNLIRLIGATTTLAHEFYLMIEFCEYGSLGGYLRYKYDNKLFVNEILSNTDTKVVWKVLIEKRIYSKQLLIL